VRQLKCFGKVVRLEDDPGVLQVGYFETPSRERALRQPNNCTVFRSTTGIIKF